ncbi:MAG: DEAD/DEAH box helicase family protein, partial [Promethearchaeota archaeon]
MQGASIKEEAWDNYQISQKQKYKITIQEDLSFMVDFPWYPFTLINAWIPIRRSHYKRERSRDLNIEDIFEYLKKEEDSEEYDRKFFFPSWVEEHYRIWTRNWRKLNGYWDHKSTHRPTKFILQFPQLIMEDIEILKRAGVEVIFSDGVKEKLGELQETGINDYLIEVETVTDKLRVRWNKKFNTWFHSIFTVFVRYMAIRSEDDLNSDYLPCVTQIGEREIEVAYWAAFRANHFWRIVEKCVKNSKTATLFKLDYQLYQLPEKKWKTDTQENYELRSYQKTAIDKWFENQQFGTIQLPTGAGKTLIGIHAIRKVQQRTLILVPNLALVDQWVDQIGKFINIKPAQIGIFTGQKKAFRKYPVVISTFQLLAQYLQDFHALEQKQVDKVSRDKILVEDTI